MTHTATPSMTHEMQDCIANCTECHNICAATAGHCLDMGGQHASRQHQTTLLDCAQICATSAEFMLRQSELHSSVCGVCAEACRRCADDCERMANGDGMMQQCAQVCRRSQHSCERMARM
ncbi:MAG TPA: four-helix bundle copper-binding protein [Gemmatimonadales bacterium]|nr:four-helix bundle copper-binding protein [Gemmatimonadales bacterium]